MKLNVQHANVRSTDELDSLVERRIFALQSRLEIEEANVRLACNYQDSPAFQVRVHLVTPGPDLVADDRDHTLRAAFEKVMAKLGRMLDLRTQNRVRRVRSNLQTPAQRRRMTNTHRRPAGAPA